MNLRILTPLVLILLVFFITVSIKAADEVNNGGGIGEKNVIYAYNNFLQLSGICLHSPLCHLSKYEQNLLERIYKAYPQEKANPNQLIFMSERHHPGWFIIDGEIKIAKTGNKVGDPIYINTDLLHLKNQHGRVTPLSIPQAISLFVHEFGHHHGEYDHIRLDLLGNKVSMMLQQNIHVAQVLPHDDSVKVLVINEHNTHSFPQVLIYVQDEFINASKVFKKSLKCPLLPLISSFPNIPGATLSRGKPKGATYHNLYWLKLKKYRGKVYKLTLKGNVAMYCKKNASLNDYSDNYKTLLSFKVKGNRRAEPVEWKYKPRSLSAKQVYEPWWGIIKLPFFNR